MNDIRFDHYVWRFAEELSLDQTQTDHARTILADFEAEILRAVGEWLERNEQTFSNLRMWREFKKALKRGEMPSDG